MHVHWTSSQFSLKPDWWIFQKHDLESQMETHNQREEQLHKSAIDKLVSVQSGPEKNFCELGKLQPLFHCGECVGAVLYAGRVTEQPVEVASDWPTQTQ